MSEEYNNGVPDRLRQVTAETMSPEVLYTLDTYPDVSPQDVIYIDESRAEGSGRLIISKGQSVKLLEEADLSTSDLVILMSVWQRNDQGDLCRGIIADCRFYKGSFGADSGKEIDFTDQEEMWETLDDQANKLVISAVIDVEDEQVKIWGDSAFFDAAVYMTKLVGDKYSKCEESDEQVLKSDTALRKSELQDKAKKAMSSFSKTCEYAVGGLNKWIRDHRK